MAINNELVVLAARLGYARIDWPRLARHLEVSESLLRLVLTDKKGPAQGTRTAIFERLGAIPPNAGAE